MAVKLEDYFRSTFEEKLFIKMPEREDDQLTPATRLLEKRREMAEVEHSLAAQKEEFQMKMVSLHHRKEELERKEYELKESLLRFDKFLKENDSKRARAIKKANDERCLKKSKDNEIDRLKDEIELFIQKREKLQKKLSRNISYHRYLDKVLESVEEFQEIRDVISRYETLTATHQGLLETEQRNQEKVEFVKQQLRQYQEDKNNEILGYNIQLAGLQTRLDRAQIESVKWESKWNYIINTATKRTLLLGRIKMATHNLYQLVVKQQRSRRDDTELDDTNEQLVKIHHFIEDLTQITNEIRKHDHHSHDPSSSQ